MSYQPRYKKNRQEVRQAGYDHGATIAVWFSIFPSKLIVPVNCSEYADDWIEACRTGYDVKRGLYNKSIKEENFGRREEVERRLVEYFRIIDENEEGICRNASGEA